MCEIIIYILNKNNRLFKLVNYRYDPSIGIYGMDFYVVLDRSGRRVAKRRRAPGRIGPSHQVGRDESVKWFQQKVSKIYVYLIFGTF